MELYIYREINKYLGITFDDFISRPRYEIKLILKNINKFLDKKNKLTSEIMENITKENSKITQNIE